MSNTLTPIAFPLTPRMQSLIELRDTLRILMQAMQSPAPYTWLTAKKEMADMLLGEGNKTPVTPNILSLFHVMGKHFKDLSEKYPDYKPNLLQAVAGLEEHAENIRTSIPPLVDFLQSDVWLTSYNELIRKQDPLGHKYALPQTINLLWSGESQHATALPALLHPVIQAIEHINQMLHAHVPWENRIAQHGADQITFAAQDNIGLLIVGVSSNTINQGILPSCSGFRSTVRLRFTQWKEGKIAQDIHTDQPYSLMLVPFS